MREEPKVDLFQIIEPGVVSPRMPTRTGLLPIFLVMMV